MSNRKSLGSSPIGLPTDDRDTLDFIPDLNGNGGDSGSSGETGSVKSAPSRPAGSAIRHLKKRTRSNSQRKSSPAADFQRKKTTSKTGNGQKSSNSGSSGSEKKIVSYYLEKDLIDRIRDMADENGSYYSALVGEALLKWVEKHGF